MKFRSFPTQVIKSDYSPSSYDDARLNRHFLPWKILKYSERLKMTKYLSRACSTWVKDGQLKAPVYNVIKVCILY